MAAVPTPGFNGSFSGDQKTAAAIKTPIKIFRSAGGLIRKATAIGMHARLRKTIDLESGQLADCARHGRSSYSQRYPRSKYGLQRLSATVGESASHPKIGYVWRSARSRP
jgi:hypothetical protein